MSPQTPILSPPAIQLWLEAVCLRQCPEFHRSPFPTRQPHVTKHCSSLSHILHNKFLFCRVLSHMVLEDFSAKHRIIFQFRWVAWFYVVLKLLDKWSQLLISVRWRESHMDDYNLLLDLEPPLCLHPPENSGSPHCGPESWCLHSDF